MKVKWIIIFLFVFLLQILSYNTGEVPKIYIKSIADLEQLMNEMWEDRESREKLSKNNAKSLATLRQRVRKYNRDFDTQIGEYKQVLRSILCIYFNLYAIQ